MRGWPVGVGRQRNKRGGRMTGTIRSIGSQLRVSTRGHLKRPRDRAHISIAIIAWRQAQRSDQKDLRDLDGSLGRSAVKFHWNKGKSTSVGGRFNHLAVPPAKPAAPGTPAYFVRFDRIVIVLNADHLRLGEALRCLLPMVGQDLAAGFTNSRSIAF
jgi:hypothetical protein